MIRRALGAIGVAVFALAQDAGAQGVKVEALADLEVWKTDTGSILLARNDGKVAPQARVRAWVVYSPLHNVELVALGEGEAGYAEDERTELYLEMLEARFRINSSLNVQAGKLLLPMGTFGHRRFSNVNPLIGEPDLYPPQYPWGIVASGARGAFDYRAGLVSLPSVNPRYSPEPGNSLRPVVGAGVRVGAAFHAGASFTRGPFLGPDVTSFLPQGTAWKDFVQTVAAADMRLSIGYVDSRVEAAWSSYEVPTMTRSMRGFGWYAETKATLSPRGFAAARFENFRYAYVGVFPPSYWIGAETVERNAEVGLGYRFSEPALVKISYRRDFWPGVPAPGAPPLPDGSALALQMSYHVDISGLLSRER